MVKKKKKVGGLMSITITTSKRMDKLIIKFQKRLQRQENVLSVKPVKISKIMASDELARRLEQCL